MALPQDDGWETVNDPSDIPADIRKSIGVAGVRKAFGIGENDKSLPDSAAKRVEDQVTIYGALKNAVGGFQDDYAGNTFTGEAENLIQSRAGGFGTPGQRDWWAAFRQNDNEIRNELFGAALTPSEQRAFEQTTVSPSMDPAEIRRNLTRRRDIIQGALSRRTNYLKANGYRPEAVDALLGEFATDLTGSDQAKGGDQTSGTAGVASNGSDAPPAGPDTPNPFNPGGQTVQFADEGPQLQRGVNRLTPEQDRDYYNFLLTKPTGEQIQQHYAAYGAGQLSAENAAQLANYYGKGGTGYGVDYSGIEVKPVDAGDGTTGSVARGAFNALTLGFGDEIGAVADTVTQGGTYAENVNRRRGYDLYDEENRGGSRLVGQLVGSLPLGGVEFLGAREAARAAGIAAVRGGAPVAEARTIANRVFATRTAAEAAGIGAVYGAGDADGDLSSRAAGAAIGGASGAVIGGATALAGGRFARALAERRAARLRQPLTRQQETLAAAERQGITPFAADVGGPVTRLATAGTAQTLGGVAPIRRAAQATIDSAQGVRDRVASALGNVVGPEEAGEVARRGIDAYRARTSSQIGRIYDAAESAGGQARVQTPEALRVLNSELTALEESPVEGAGVSILQGLRDRLQGEVTVRGLRNARTVLREEFENNGLRRSNTERIANRVLDAATDDIIAGLRSQGNERAANLYQRADRLWRERTANIDENLEPILGAATGAQAKSGEQIVANLRQAMSGNNRRFAGFVSSLPPEDRGTVRASLVSRLGRATNGQQDETGERFSFETFLSNWNDIGDRAKNTLFGEEGRAALNDLARVAAGSRQAQRFSNFSNTGAAVSTSALGAVALGGPVGVAAAAKAVIGSYAAGRLLASPRFARWLARPPRTSSPAATQAYIARLSRIARAEPAIANDVLSLQQRLADTFGAAPARMAAQEGPDRGAPVEGQASSQQGANQGLQP